MMTCAALLALAVGIGRGVAAMSPAAELSLPDCLMLAREHSVQMAQGRSSKEQAAATYREASASRLPQLSVKGAYDKSDDPSTQLPDANNAVVHLEQPLVPLSAEWQQARQRKAELSAADLERIQTERDVERLVRQLYFGIVQGRQAVDDFSTVKGELDNLLTAVLPRYNMGRAPSFDLIKVKTAIVDIEKSRDDRQSRLIGETATLAQTVGLAATSRLALTPLRAKPSIPSDEEVEKNLDLNPGLKALAQRVEAARIGTMAAGYARLPNLIGAGEYGWSGQTPNATSRGWDVSVALRLPLFDWGAISSRVAQQRAATMLASSRFDLERQGLVADALEARARAQTDLARSEKLLKLLPDSRRVALASIERYRRGAAGILEATDAINLWLSTLLEERSAYYSYLADLSDLNWLEGREPGPDGL